IGDSCIVCFDVSACCRGNTAYFNRLEKVLDHPDASGIVMTYLLNRNIYNWNPGKIPSIKMKVDTMHDQLPSPIRFIIDYIASWTEDGIFMKSHSSLYQKYFEWCRENGEKLLASKVSGKSFLKLVLKY
ncbi:15496_t:CDS:2, partial [Funneliformis geosporum]